MGEQENPLDRDHCLSVVLPGGMEKNATVHGSKPVMDLLVTLCASYHLNPSDYTVEFLSPNKNNISFKPNSPIGSLEAEKIVLKPRVVEEKIRRPYMPEASVRLLINYNKSHKTVVRVNPRVALEMLLPAVCDKCEFQVETTILLKDSYSEEPLDLSKTLNEHGLREVFAKDTAAKEPEPQEAAVTQTEVITPPPLQDLPKQEKKQKDNTGFLSLFRKKKNKAAMDGERSAPASPAPKKQVGDNVRVLSSSNTLPLEMPKKRRAPQPPIGASQSVPNNLGNCHVGESQRSADSTLRSTKRRAPPPPCVNTHQEVKASVDSLTEDLRESDESESVSLPSSSSPSPSHPRSSSSFLRSSSPSSRSFAHLYEVADPYLPSFRGKDLSDARSALAKVLMSSMSKGALVRRVRNSASFPKLYNDDSLKSMTPGRSVNGGFCVESVLEHKLPTEWQDPAHRKGMTTFKVVPSGKSYDPELTTEQGTVEDHPESEGSTAEPEEDPPGTETPLQHPVPPEKSLQCPKPPEKPLRSPELSESPLQIQDSCGKPVRSQEPSKTPCRSPEPPEKPLRSPDLSQKTILVQECSEKPLGSPEPSETPLQSPKTPEKPSGSPEPSETALQSPKTPEKPSGSPEPSETALQSPKTPEKPSGSPEPSETALQSPKTPEKPSGSPEPSETPLQSPKTPEKPSGSPEPSETPLQSPKTPEKPSGSPEPSETALQSPGSSKTHLQSPETCEKPLQSPKPPEKPLGSPEPFEKPLGSPELSEKPLQIQQSSEKTLQSPEPSEPPLGSPEQFETPFQSAEPSELPRDGQIILEDQSHNEESESKDVNHCGSLAEVKQEVVQEEEETEDCFPPPPPPVYFEETIEEKEDASSLSSSQQPSPTSNGIHQKESSRKPANPAPSRFAEAVALRVQRSHLRSTGKGLGAQVQSRPLGTPPSPPRSPYQNGA
ncbi:cordon-bleu protein-like 1 [Trematomus bernacchii]|uniref:cordon-bleu protein-like 1 n=1 Tax=Trematomus bernacchii TaxID=40690 RepID=UPI00146E2003|nr:cordon-bleu protein-like 1 [Trematomus bernacchii]